MAKQTKNSGSKPAARADKNSSPPAAEIVSLDARVRPVAAPYPAVAADAAPKPASSGIDMRSWMRDLEIAGLLRRVKAEVDWDEEIGALARINLALGGPALLFESIKDHHETLCTRLMTCGMATRAHVLAMVGQPGDTSDKALVRHFKEVYRAPIKPHLVETGAVDLGPINSHELPIAEGARGFELIREGKAVKPLIIP